jgi:hypothetical protein
MNDALRFHLEALRQRLGQSIPVPPVPVETELEELRRRHEEAERGPAQERRGLCGRSGAASSWRPLTEIVDPRDGSRIGA